MNRRDFCLGVSAGALPPSPANGRGGRAALAAAGATEFASARGQDARPSFSDGQTIVAGDREHVLSDILAPSPAEPAGDFALAILQEALRRGAPIAGDKTTTDRWGRIAGPVRWRMPRRETTLQEILLAQGAARVAPQSDDLEFIERCFVAERHARAARLGLWSRAAYRVRDATRAEWSRGYQIYWGTIATAAERGNRVYFNFGADYHTDFTATVLKSAFRRWKTEINLATTPGRIAEVRGIVEAINGPSIELRHEMQLRFS